MSAVALREDHDAASLRGLAKASKNAGGTRRLLALAAIYEGSSRTDAARIGAVGLQTVRELGSSVQRARSRGPRGWPRRQGPKSKLNEKHRRALVAKIEAGPIPAADGVVRWAPDRPGAMDFRGLRRLRYQADPQPRAAPPWDIANSRRVPVIMRRTRRLRSFLKRFPCRRGSRRREDRRQADRDLVSGRGRGLARRTRSRGAGRSAAPGRPPERSADTASTYIFGAICPTEGKGAGLVLPRLHHRSDGSASRPRSPPWSRPAPTPSSSSTRPDGISPRRCQSRPISPWSPLPAKSPELNPVENIWQFHARQLDFEPRLHVLRRYRRTLLLRLEQAHRPTLERSCRSACAIGHIGSDLRDLVLPARSIAPTGGSMVERLLCRPEKLATSRKTLRPIGS